MQLALTMKAISDQSDVYPFERSEAVLDLLALRACDILYRYGSSFRYAGFPIDRKDATVSIQDQSQFVEGDDLEEPQIILSRLLTFRVDMSYTSPTIYTPAFVEAMGLTERN